MWCISVNLSLSHYPVPGVVLECIFAPLLTLLCTREEGAGSSPITATLLSMVANEFIVLGVLHV